MQDEENPVRDENQEETSVIEENTSILSEDELDSVATEEGASEDRPTAQGDDLAKLLEDARSKTDDYWEQLVRAKAEIENLKRRHARELENAHKYGLDKFVESMLGVWDSLELGHQAAQDESADMSKLLEGTELTLKMLVDAMQKIGVEQVDPLGEPFDPEKHQAMSMQPSEEYPPNTVTTVIQKGYILNGRLVRPALVMVSQ